MRLVSGWRGPAAVMLVSAFFVVAACRPSPPPPLPPPATPTTCPADSQDDAACRQRGMLRWLVSLDTRVGIQVTEEHGHLAWVAPVVCPDDATATASDMDSGDWYDCAIQAVWRFDGEVMWLVNGDDVLGVNADTGVVVEETAAAGRAAQVTALADQTDATAWRPDDPDFPAPETLGLVAASAAVKRIVHGPGDARVGFAVGCVAGSERDIPGAIVSHGAPAWAQVCTQPVVYAVNL